MSLGHDGWRDNEVAVIGGYGAKWADVGDATITSGIVKVGTRGDAARDKQG